MSEPTEIEGGPRRPRPIPAGWVPMIRRAMKWFGALNVLVYRATRGRLMGEFPGGGPICLVRMRGAKTGKERLIPLIHVAHGDAVILVASQGGTDVNPLWYGNLKANPDVEINFRGNVRKLRARQVSPEEKARIWPVAVAAYAPFQQYQERTKRDIPVFLCEP